MSAVEGWKTDSLGRVAQLTMGQSPDSKYYSADDKAGMSFLQGCAEFQSRFPAPSLFCSQAKKVANRGSILFSVRAPVGKINIADRDYIIGRGLAAISGSEVDQDYLEHYLAYVEPRFRNASQGSTFEAINSTELNGWPIEYPTSKSEQTKIAEILSTVDLAIEHTEALVAKQQRIKTGMMQDLLTRGIDEHNNLRSERTHEFKDSPLGRIPVEWEVGGFDDYVVNDAGIKPGPFGSSLTKDMHVETGYRVYGQEQVIGGSLDLGNYFISERKFTEMAGFAVSAGDVLISLVGTIGHVLIVPKGHHPGVINPRLLRFRPESARCLPEFLKAVLLSQPIRLQLDTFATGGTMPVISAGIIRKLCVVIIGVDEQVRIVQIINKSDECVVSSSVRLNKLRSLKTALMQDLLTGKKRITALLNETEVLSS